MALRDLPAGAGLKPPDAAGVKSLGRERSGKRPGNDRVRYAIRRRTEVNRHRGVVSELHEVKNRVQRLRGESVHREPVYWMGGLRHKDGAN